MDIQRFEDYERTSPDGFTKRVLLRSSSGLVFLLNFEPGQTLPAHPHAESEIAVMVLDGTGEATVDGRVERLGRGVLLHCTGGERFSMRNSGTERLSVLVFLYPGNARFANDVR